MMSYTPLQRMDEAEMNQQTLCGLVKTSPNGALQFLNKCISTVIYDVRAFEDNDDLTEGEISFSLAGRSGGRASTQGPNIHLYENHPVTHMIKCKKNDLLQHKVTLAWLNHKWYSYAFWVHCIFILLDVFYLTVIVGYINTVGIIKNNSSCEEVTKKEDFDKKTPSLFYIFLCISLVILFLQEFFIAFKLGNVKATEVIKVINLEVFIRYTYFFLVLLLVISPLEMSNCNVHFGVVQKELDWQFGVFAVLMAWLCLMNSISMTLMSDSLPITKDIVCIFVKVAFNMIAFVLIFAFMFHILLKGDKVSKFATFPQAIGSTMSWMFLDLDYGDIFVKSQLQYPCQTTFIFFFFITTIVSIIMNLISKDCEIFNQGKLHSQSFRRVALRASLIFMVDISFPWICKRFALTEIVIENNNEKNFLKQMLEITNSVEIEEEEEGDKNTAQMDKMMNTLNERFEALKDILKEINEHYATVIAPLNNIPNQAEKNK